jgi:hypothetical protein
MTVNEAYERACFIWGKARVISVRGYGLGADVNLKPTGAASDTRDRNYSAHRLDGNGHAVCHEDCKQLEVARRPCVGDGVACGGGCAHCEGD